MKRRLIVPVLIILAAIPIRAEKYALLVDINNYPNDISHYDIVWLMWKPSVRL